MPQSVSCGLVWPPGSGFVVPTGAGDMKPPSAWIQPVTPVAGRRFDSRSTMPPGPRECGVCADHANKPPPGMARTRSGRVLSKTQPRSGSMIPAVHLASWPRHEPVSSVTSVARPRPSGWAAAPNATPGIPWRPSPSPRPRRRRSRLCTGLRRIFDLRRYCSKEQHTYTGRQHKQQFQRFCGFALHRCFFVRF